MIGRSNLICDESGDHRVRMNVPSGDLEMPKDVVPLSGPCDAALYFEMAHVKQVSG